MPSIDEEGATLVTSVKLANLGSVKTAKTLVNLCAIRTEIQSYWASKPRFHDDCSYSYQISGPKMEPCET